VRLYRLGVAVFAVVFVALGAARLHLLRRR
jgi:hypothetical protein